MCNLPRILNPITVHMNGSRTDRRRLEQLSMAGQHRIENMIPSTYTNNQPLSHPTVDLLDLLDPDWWLFGCRCFPGSAESLMICVLMRVESRSRLPFKRNPTCRLVVCLDLLLQSKRSQACRLGFNLFAWTRMPFVLVRVKHLDLFG